MPPRARAPELTVDEPLDREPLGQCARPVELARRLDGGACVESRRREVLTHEAVRHRKALLDLRPQREIVACLRKRTPTQFHRGDAVALEDADPCQAAQGSRARRPDHVLGSRREKVMCATRVAGFEVRIAGCKPAAMERVDVLRRRQTDCVLAELCRRLRRTSGQRDTERLVECRGNVGICTGGARREVTRPLFGISSCSYAACSRTRSPTSARRSSGSSAARKRVPCEGHELSPDHPGRSTWLTARGSAERPPPPPRESQAPSRYLRKRLRITDDVIS
jgi:hypothetical protein